MTSQTTELSAVTIGSPETPLVIIFNRLPNGDLAADLKGNMDPQEVIHQLRFIADHIENKGIPTAHPEPEKCDPKNGTHTTPHKGCILR